MRIRALLATLIVAASLGVMPGAADARWAAIAPNNENTAKVAWANSKDEAARRALAACRRVSKTCADKPAATDDMDDIFVTMCCLKPRFGCVVSPRATIKEGREGALKVLDDHGFTECAMQSALRASDGRRID